MDRTLPFQELIYERSLSLWSGVNIIRRQKTLRRIQVDPAPIFA